MRALKQFVYFLIMLSGITGLAFPAQAKKVTIFPDMEGWKRTKNIQVYNRSTIFHYIDGAADLYLSYNFQDLQVAEYKEKKKAQVIIEVYRHLSPGEAFGIYSQERPMEGNFINIGYQGYTEGGVLNFVTGKYYVKLHGYYIEAKDESVLLAFAKKIEKNLSQKIGSLKILESFPAENKKKNSEKFIVKNVLGYSFFHSGYTTDYEKDNTKFRLFILEGKDGKDCESMLSQYFEKIGQNQRIAREGELYSLKDPYHGSIAFVWSKNYIWGVIGLHEAELQEKYLNLAKEGLLTQKLIK